MWQLLDFLFLVVHTGIMGFNLFGWMWRKTRRANLALLLLTAFSWFGLGLWYGWGYCICTDWHWKVLDHLKIQDLPNSYITYLLQRFTNWNLPQTIIDTATVSLFFLALPCSVFTNWRDWKKHQIKLSDNA
jgi:hypothetical protein